MTTFTDIYYDLQLRARSARRRQEDLVLSLEEAIAIHDACFGTKIPYQHPERFLGVPVRVLDPERPRIELRPAPLPRRNSSA